jgi:hypothetical protein
LVSTTSSVLDTQTPLLIVQRSVALVPATTPVTPLTGEAGVVIAAAPETTVHKPDPTPGALPDITKFPLLQLFWSAPAEETVGN